MKRRPGEGERRVFLDIDGVLTSFKSGDRLDRRCIGRLNRLLERSRSEVVVTSSWKDVFGLETTVSILRSGGFVGRVAGQTDYRRRGDRTDEILRYLYGMAAEDIRIVILDDVPVRAVLRPYLVLVDEFSGLTNLDVTAAARILAHNVWTPKVGVSDGQG